MVGDMEVKWTKVCLEVESMSKCFIRSMNKDACDKFAEGVKKKLGAITRVYPEKINGFPFWTCEFITDDEIKTEGGKRMTRMEKSEAVKNIYEKVGVCMEDLIGYANELEELKKKREGEGLRRIIGWIENWLYGDKIN